MKSILLAAASLAALGVMLADRNPASARGPLEVEAQDLLILAKESGYTEIEAKDFPFGLEDGRTEKVRLTFEQTIQAPEEDGEAVVEYVVTMPWLDVERDGDQVTVRFPESQTFDVNATSPDGEEITFTADMETEDSVMTFKRDGERMTYSGSAKSFSAVMKTPEAIADEATLDYSISGKGMKIEGAGAAEQDWADLRTLDISYDYTIDSMDFAVDLEAKDPSEDMPPISFKGATGTLAAAGKIGEGVVEGGGTMTDMAIDVLKPMPLELFFGKFRTDMSMPTEPSPDPQSFRYLIEAEKIEIDEQLWAMADPEGAFPRELNKLVIDMAMQARLFVSFLDPAAIAKAEEEGMPPMMPTAMKINSIAFDGLGLQVDAEGEGALNGMQPEAEATITVNGLSEFVQSAMKAGAFEEQEAMMVEGMAKQFGKENPDGTLVFEIKTENGMIVVNDNPVAPLPGPGAQ